MEDKKSFDMVADIIQILHNLTGLNEIEVKTSF